MTRFDDILLQLRAVAEVTRLRALRVLAEGDLTVSELTEILGQSQPRVSRHLKVLADAKLVEGHQEGAWTFYRLSDVPLLASLGLVSSGSVDVSVELLAADDEALDRLRAERAAVAASYFAEQAPQWEELRSLHIDDETIETRLLDLAGDHIDMFVDLGTGTGRMLVAFRDRYQRGIGFDTSPEMLALARANLSEAHVTNAQVRRADFLEDPLPENIDVICFHHVLHFVAEPGRSLRTVAEALSDSGKILIADFAPHEREELRDAYAHRRLGFSDDEISRWARLAGLTITASEEFAPPVAGGLTSRIWRLSKRSSAAFPTQSTIKSGSHVVS